MPPVDLSQYKTIKEMKAYAVAQFATISQLIKEKEDLQAKVKQLEELIQKMEAASRESNWIVTATEPISEEERICIQQISYLYEASQVRPLSHEEIKSLDLLVKNLKSIRKPVEEDPLKEARKLSPAELLLIAEGELVSISDNKNKNG